jgi:hypothetical protein
MLNPDIIYTKFDLNPLEVLIPKYGKRQEATVADVIEALYLYDKEAKDHLGIVQAATFRKYIKQLFPELNLRGLNNRTWSSWLLAETGYKKCNKCSEVKSFESFSKDKYASDGYKYECKKCVYIRTSTEQFKLEQSERNRVLYAKNLEKNRAIRREHYYNNKEMYKINCAKRRAAKLQAIPPWANLEEIKQFYLNCPEGYEVDHIHPLQGENICGLHVINNLQYLTVQANRSKGNKFIEEGVSTNENFNTT